MNISNSKETYTDIMALNDAARYEESGKYDEMFDSLSRGLTFNPYNYELYFSLGFYYVRKNINQAYLCFQNALHRCGILADSNPQDQALQDDYAQILSAMNEIASMEGFAVKDTAIIIVTYNSLYLQQKNIESIRTTLPANTYKIIAVDNASGDGCLEWLKTQEDITLIANSENKGFSAACNQGAEFCDDYDIFLLNNDTRLSANSLFWLKMGLYENDSIGATGAISNSAGNNQSVELFFDLPQQYVDYGCSNNVPMVNPYDERVRLSGFAMLIRHNLWKFVGGMDEIFSPGYFEDDDISMKLISHGCHLLVCKNSFIYHAGSQSFSKLESANSIILKNYNLFKNKYCFDIIEHFEPHYSLLSKLAYSNNDTFNLLIIGCGIGADITHLSHIYPNANIVGLEKDKAQYNIASKYLSVFNAFEELQAVLKVPAFMSIIITPQGMNELNNTDLAILNSLCMPNCKVIKDTNNDISFEKIKMVIWDLDETFWKGTLSEGNVEEISSNTNLIVHLCDCGIINSISSKNNEADAINKLDDLDITGAFVFNNINWFPKGPQIAQKINDMNLRPENVLFIDDNPHNLEEAKYYAPGIVVSGPECINILAEYVSRISKKDIQHNRLNQYKILEQKKKALTSENSVEDFLYASNIRICISQYCLSHVDRIADLVARSNQLNYTKRRERKEALIKLLSDSSYETVCVFSIDNFGDYGLIGFYCIEKATNKVLHFLFSCRVMGMGIEQYIYATLKFPQMDVVAPVTIILSQSEKPGWISEINYDEYINRRKTSANSNKSVLLKGPCDMDSVAPLLESFSLTREFNYINPLGRVVTSHNHSIHLTNLLTMNSDSLGKLIDKIPFLSHGDFDSTIFSVEYDVICFSLLPDCGSAVYRRKSDGQLISFGNKLYDLTDAKNISKYCSDISISHGYSFTPEILNSFSSEWEYIGATPSELLINNLELIYKSLKGSPKLILLLGSEIACVDSIEEFRDSEKQHQEVNPVVTSWATDKPDVYTINVTEFIKSQYDYIDCANHYSKRVYAQIAKKIIEIIES